MSSQQAIRAQNDYIFNLQVQADKYARLISSVNLRIKTIDEEWKTVREKLAELRLKRNEGDQRGGGINAVKSKIMSESREVGKLENRLASCRTRLSNMNLEEQDAFDEIYQNLAIVITREKENAEAFRKEAMKSEALDTHEDGYFRGNFRIDEESEMKQTLQKLDVAVPLRMYSDELKEGSANMRKRLIESLEDTRQKILKENADYERLRQTAQREFGPVARAVDKLYNSLGCNEMMPPSGGPVAPTGVGKANDDRNAMMIRMSSMNDLLAAHGITEGNILQFLAIIEQRSNDLVEQFTRRLQHKHPQNLATTSLGAHLQPSDPNRANGLHLNFNLNQAPPLLTSHDANSGDPDNNSGDEDDSLVPVSTAELQRKAAKTLAMQLSNAKMSPTRNKKKKQK
ncbi:hypothetical protein DYB30_005338 [Aphanomyces astaci]|uniref:Uncharacterized protein n=1 Tax=Aphanomyces astaci TaxID=112090 RepID=A0A397F114_APHAT|nr:hypothetical protein DYB38_008526 [Aphanomyces astaci]RHY67200.1 hypothetical protein DYB30_005338 [Aphanomyces astaci]RHZ05642.1 hypothetical protein DYB31_007928 [Aphanomyces astaci]